MLVRNDLVKLLQGKCQQKLLMTHLILKIKFYTFTYCKQKHYSSRENGKEACCTQIIILLYLATRRDVENSIITVNLNKKITCNSSGMGKMLKSLSNSQH